LLKQDHTQTDRYFFFMLCIRRPRSQSLRFSIHQHLRQTNTPPDLKQDYPSSVKMKGCEVWEGLEERWCTQIGDCCSHVLSTDFLDFSSFYKYSAFSKSTSHQAKLLLKLHRSRLYKYLIWEQRKHSFWVQKDVALISALNSPNSWSLLY